jgi:anhydro-N-acetylmuramic acid kinase
LYHEALFSSKGETLAVVNIGGIANVSHLSPELATQGYDIGPGNALIDSWIQTSLARPYDANGDWARSGKVIPSLLAGLLKDPYFSLTGPKSIGKEYFSLTWLKQHLTEMSYSAADIQATLLELTVITIADTIRGSSPYPKALLICGGGVHNQYLLESLQQKLSPLPVLSTAHHGINPDFIEAMMFAWLASQTLHQKPLNFTAITHASSAAIYGVVYPATEHL